MHLDPDNISLKNDFELQKPIIDEEKYFAILQEYIPYSSELLFDSPLEESYSTDTTSSSPIMQQGDAFSSLMRGPLLSDKPLRIDISGINQEGAKSRVETQIKLHLKIKTKETHPWSFIKINKNMLVKSKVRKSEQKLRQTPNSNLVEFSDSSKVLSLEAKVIHSNIDQEIRICEGCIRRERKRSERIKDNKARDEIDEKNEKERILLFNCNSLLSFSSNEITLPTRITCYCRHHNEKVGFRIRFTIKNDREEVVALGTSPPIMITDDHKNPKNKMKFSSSNKGKRPRELNDLVTSPPLPKKLPILNGPIKSSHLPTSISIPHSDPVYLDSLPTPPAEQLPFKRRRNASPSFYSSVLLTEEQTSKPFPRLDRIISAQGPTYGGTEVILLGSGFYDGLTCLFGDRVATITAVYPNIIVCQLPAAPHPGPVVVSFKESSLTLEAQGVVIFTYYDANDEALLEFALQLVGLKTTGKLHNAKKVAMDIVHGNLNNSYDSDSTHPRQELPGSVLKSPTSAIGFPTLLQANENRFSISLIDALARIQT